MNRFGRTPIVQNIFDAFRAGAGGGGNKEGAPLPDSHIPGKQAGDTDAAAAAERAKQEAQQKAKQSPLAEFATLWDTKKPAEGEAAPANWDDPNSIVPSFNIDPEKLVAASKRLDYTKSMNPDRVKAALSGDVGAFMEVINSALQASFANSSMATARFTEASFKRMAPSLINDVLPHHVRKHAVRDAVVTDNPIFNDPAAAPLLEGLESKLREKYPQASAKEISDHAKKFLNGFAQSLQAPGAAAAAAKGKARPGDFKGIGSEDWTEFFVPGEQVQQ